MAKCESAAGGLVTAQDQAGGVGFGDQLAVFVGDFTFDVADGAAALNDAAFGAQFGDAHGAKEIDFEFYGGERLAGSKGAGEGNAHGGVGNVAQDAAVDGAHRIEMFFAGFEKHDGAAI